ncbi:MAG: hypothetical protein MUC49_06840 [Raineya sp.]|jgi:hypothetical protein|nr:hypothetical protein [Raineya sp.]
MNHKYLYATICLLVSLWIYVFYRVEQIVVNRIIISITSPAFFKQVSLTIRNLLPLPNFVVYSLPEGLWVFAITIISGSQILKIGKIKLTMIYIPLIVACLIELVQYMRWSKGTFDILDIAVVWISWMLAYMFEKQNSTKHFQKPKVFYIFLMYMIVVLSCAWK